MTHTTPQTNKGHSPTETETPAGFQKTEVGVIPEDWEIGEVQNLCRITTGNKNTQDKIDSGAFPFFVRSQSVERINSYSFNGEAVLTAGDGVGTGKVFHYINGKFDYHQRVYKMSDFTEKLDGYFFFQYFSNKFFHRIMQMTAKSSVDSIRREMIAKMAIPVPTKAEQTAIATALGDMDALLEAQEKLLAKKRALKQGAMQELLKPKEGWVEKRLGEMLKYEQPTKYLVSNTEYNPNSGVPVLTAGKSFFLGYTNEIAGIYSNPPVIIFDDFTTSSQYVDFRFKVKSSALKILSTRSESYSLVFLYNLMKLIRFDATDHKRYWISEFQNMELQVASKSEQTRIAQILTDLDTEIEHLETQLEKYRLLKRGMMQELLTGKKRLV